MRGVSRVSVVRQPDFTIEVETSSALLQQTHFSYTSQYIMPLDAAVEPLETDLGGVLMNTALIWF